MDSRGTDMIKAERLNTREKWLVRALARTAGSIAMLADEDTGLSYGHLGVLVMMISETLQETLEASYDEVTRLSVETYNLWVGECPELLNLQQPNTRTASENPGVVYILRCGNSYKIGMTRVDVTKRLAALQTGSPERMEMITVIACDNPADLERRLHSMFAAKRLEGEWFALDPGDVELLKRVQ